MYNNENEKNLVKELDEAREELREIYDKTEVGDLKKALLSLSNRLFDAAAMLEEMDEDGESYVIRLMAVLGAAQEQTHAILLKVDVKNSDLRRALVYLYSKIHSAGVLIWERFEKDFYPAEDLPEEVLNAEPQEIRIQVISELHALRMYARTLESFAKWNRKKEIASVLLSVSCRLIDAERLAEKLFSK